MPAIAADFVDVYVFRKVNARVQFLLLLRQPDVGLGNTWQSIHTKIEPGESGLAAAARAVKTFTGLDTVDTFSADYINQFYEHASDTIILAPVFAVTVDPRAVVELGEDYCDSAWFERDEATARLIYAGQRWAVRHIDEIIGLGGPEAELYRVSP